MRNRFGHFIKNHGENIGIPRTTLTKIKISLSKIGKGMGKNNPCWRGGKSETNGYTIIYCTGHPYSNNNYVYEHRLVMEKHIGRYLKPNEIIHHINECKTDNRLENLALFKNSGHHLNFHRRLKNEQNPPLYA